MFFKLLVALIIFAVFSYWVWKSYPKSKSKQTSVWVSWKDGKFSDDALAEKLQIKFPSLAFESNGSCLYERCCGDRKRKFRAFYKTSGKRMRDNIYLGCKWCGQLWLR